jgi:hypothetical protein
MGSIIEYKTWDGGEGWNCPTEVLGYCKESPQEILEQILWTHDVYHYKDLYRPIDYGFPNNVEGLVINEFNRKDLEIKGNFKDIDLSRAKTRNKRTKETIKESFERCKKWHCCGKDEVNIKYNDAFKEVEIVINKIR